MSRPAVLGAAAAGAVLGRGAWYGLRAATPGGAERWSRVNHRGRQVSLLAGPAAALGAAAACAAAPGAGPGLRLTAALAAAASGAVGAFDDLAGSSSDKGFRGHLAALRRGEVSSGLLKVAVIGATGLAAGRALHRHPADALLAGAVVAGSANLVNLLDLRPGRAVKACLLVSGPGVAGRALAGRTHAADAVTAGTLGVAAALLPDDLAERVMLGDAGANALGAALGVAAAARSGRRGLVARAAALVALTLASERVSFTGVIERVPPLRALDRLGRLPVGDVAR